ncbi:transcription termination factor MTERF8, chloroplastic-like [Miscanthus floridulus]|uniref:transcription termination factor MTERF8, chloroplastic-like n=1 Tax=Miscanthus floridulus TaxID=154761 RepID=UPI0034582DA1
MLHLRNHLLPHLRAASPLLSPIHRHRACLLSASAAAPFSLEDYLVAACGLSPAQARKASKQALEEASREAGKPFEELRSSRLNSASNPDAVLALLSSAGVSRADIAAVVAADPLILRSCVNKIGPRLLALRDRIGLSAPQISRFLLVGSRKLRSGDVCPNLEFLISSFGSLEPVLAVMKGSKSILTLDLDRVIKPNFAQFRQCGLTSRDIAQMCSYCPWLIGFQPERVKDFLLRAEDLGVSRGSPMFKHMVAAMSRTNKEKNAATLEFLKRSLGCSESEAAFAVSKTPSILGLSDECLLPKIQFLNNEVGLEPQYILQNPSLLTYSLEKRLVPRYCAMKILRAKGLMNSNFCRLAQIGEQKFRLKFIDRHKDSVSGLVHAYVTARAALVPSGV